MIKSVIDTPIIMDVCCGSRAFWKNKNNPNVLFNDIRRETHTLCDGRKLVINPDTRMDFTNLEMIADGSMKLVVFDPPHLKKVGNKSWMFKKFGKIDENYKDTLRQGFAECFRVLEDYGILIFKWSETDILTSTIIKLSEYPPLFGHPSGKRANTHWLCFMKLPGRRE